MARKLKVFSAEMGFVRAVVAAPSRKAALEAWGVRDDLFARGTAREETDPALVKEAAATPGEVLKTPVASTAEMISAADPRDRAPAKAARPAKRAAAAKPAPSRRVLDAADANLHTAEAARRKALAEIDAERKALDTKQDALEARLQASIRKLEKARDSERAAYDKAFKAWKG